MKLPLLIVSFSVFFHSCAKKTQAAGSDTPAADTIHFIYPVLPIIQEASGIADSKNNPGFLWAEEDSGNPPQLTLIGHDGKVKRKVFIKGAANRDWEDIALVGNDIYLPDIGDNNQVHSSSIIYKFPEPATGVDTVFNFEAIEFIYSDGPHDAEALLVDPVSKDIYIITKRDNPSRIYKLTYPYSTSTINTAQQVGTLPYTYVVSAALSPDAKEIIVKTYPDLYHYTRPAGISIPAALQQSFTKLQYIQEPQGEAVTFALDDTGYYTLSEKGPSSEVNLHFYKTK